ncbi:MAG: glycosyltransferase family A protein [Actinomycetota bacterium]
MRFDLVLATVGRTQDVVRFLRALEAQSYRDFRLLVVDQNSDERLAPVLVGFEKAFEIVRLRSQPGLSRARNAAFAHLAADIVAFPDDDCWYPRDLLQRVADFFAAHPKWDGLGVRPVDELGRQSAGRADTEAGAMTAYNLWGRVGSYTLFLRRPVLDEVGPFDETLGVGTSTPWRAGEDLDYVARAVNAGRRVFYDPSLHVHHPQKREHTSRPDVRQGYEYGAGFGRALRKNRLPWWFATYCVVRSCGASLLNLLAGRPARARFYLAVARGRVCGWLGVRTEA